MRWGLGLLPKFTSSVQGQGGWVCCCGMTGTCLVKMACFMSRTPCLVYVGPTAGAAGRPGCRVGRPKCGTLGRSVGGRKAAG